MLKKCTFSILFTMLAMAGVANAATLDIPEDLFVEQDLEGCYLLKDKYDLYWFANKVNTENTTYATACAKLTADIVVNERVLTDAQGTECVGSTGSYSKCSEEFRNSLYGWTPIGIYNSKPFQGTFDGLGHTISGLYDGREKSYTGLFGYVSGTNATVSIKNVGVKDSYFRVSSYAGGIVGRVYDGSGELNIENVYSASTFYIKGEGFVGGLLGRVGSGWTLNITNAYNSGSIFVASENTTANYVAGLVGCISGSATVKNAFNYGNLPSGSSPLVYVSSTVYSVENSFYLGDAAQGNYGVNKSASDFSNGAVLALLQQGENGSVWQSGSPYPTLLINSHKADLIYLGDAVSRGLIYFIEGFGYAKSLPTIHLDGSPILGWYENQSFTGTKYTEIPADVKRDLQLYPKLYKPVDGCYEISDADELYAYASIVNGTLVEGRDAEPTACGKLNADIVVNQNVLGTDNANVNADGSYNNAQAASAFRVWTPIGNGTNKFQGSFNGKGHTISGLYFNNSTTSNVGLFGCTNGVVTIDSVGVVDSYFQGKDNVGSIVGQAASVGTKELTVTRSFNKGAVTGTDNVGGLVGKNGNVKFSYNKGSVTGTSNVGGLVGSNILQGQNKFEINGSYNVGLVKMGTGSGNAVLGEGCPTGSQTGAVKNVYYLDGFGAACLGALPMTSYEFADGFVAIMLHNDPVNGANIWGQIVGTDKTPLLTGEIVFPIALDNSDDCYEISNADDLYIFAAIVNSGFKSDACGKLTENIVVNENVLTSAGELNTAPVGGFKEWTPIGNWDNPFQGTFHGQGHTISGLYFNDTETEDVGLFGDVYGTVVIDSVGLVDSYINAGGWVGGLVGYARGSLTISNSYNASSVTSFDTFGGLVGAANGVDDETSGILTISNSYNIGSLNGRGFGGGLVGYADALVVSNSYNAGAIYIYNSEEDGAHVGGIASKVNDASTVTNSFNYGTISYPSNIEVVVDDLVAIGDEGIVTVVTVTNSFTIGTSRFEDDGATQKSATEFADGTVFALLRNAEDGEVWRQYKNDAYPTFAAKTGTDAPSPMHVATLHYSETDSVVIAYTEGTAKSLPTKDPEGNAIVGWTTSADGSGNVITEIPTSATTDLKLYPKIKTFEPNAEGFYEIATADDLYKFAEIVNSGTVPDAKAKLIADICVNACGEGESVLGTDNANVDADGNYIGAASASFREWTPIGIFDNPFNGTFDGQGHTISGLYFNDDEKPNVGLFGYVSGEGVTVSISNVGVEDSYFNAQSAVGGVVGWVDYASLDMKNVYNAAVVVGASFVGGVVGYVGLDSQTLSMTNVYNVGLINCEDVGQAGGLVGEFGNDSEESKVTIKNSYNYGEVVGGNSLVGYVESEYENVENVSVSNSYYLGDAAQSDYGTVKSSAEFADGTVYAALHSTEDGEVWRQYAGDDYPTLVAKTGTGAPSPMHVATLHYSETDSVVFAYTEGAAGLLPAKLDDGSILIWYKDENLSGDAYTKIAVTENGDLNFYAKAMKLDSDGYYEIADADMLFKFAELVNTQNSTYGFAKVKLTADIVVNENVLTTASGTSNVNANGAYIGADSASFRVWTPIGGYTDNSQMSFEGTFDGQGHTISGLYLNKGTAKGNEISALFGIVGGDEVSIKNVGIEDSYFAAQRYVGGIVGLSVADMLKIENCYNDATLYGIYGIAGLVGELNSGERSLTIENSYNSGTIKYDLSSGGSPSATGALVGDAGNHANVINSYYLVQEGVESEFGTAASSDAFANGTVATLLHGNGVDADSLWGQNVTGGESHPTFFKGINVEDGPGVIYNGSFSSITVTLHYSEDDADTSKFEHVVGIIEKLPATDKNGNFVLGWYKNATFADEKYAEVSYTENADLDFYAKIMKVVDGCYQIADAEMLFEFAAIVNGGESSACGKLTEDIEVNKNVLAAAGGVSNVNTTTGAYTGDTTGLREWTPINNFNGEFDGDGFSISGLYYNGSENGVGLFGYLLKNGKNVSIKNVGVEDSYFKGNSSVGGILGRVEEGSTVNIENVYNAAFVVAEGSYAGGIVGCDYGNKMSVTNAYNIGQVLALSQQGYAGGIVGRNYSDVESFIKNSYNYGSVSASTNRGEIVGYVDGTTLSVANSYYLADHTGDDGARPASDFENGTVLAALRAGEGGYVWVQAEGDKYPTIDINASKNANTIVLDWTNAADSTTLVAAGYTDSAMVIVKDGKKFYANGAIYEGILSADQVAAIGDDMLHPVSGIKLATVNNELVATVNADSDEPLMIPTDVEVSEVVYERVLTKGVYATIMVPFSVPVSSVSGFSFYKFKRVGQTNEGKWAVYVSTVKDSLRANTPYIIVASNNATQITFKLDDYLTLNTTSDVYETTNGNWTMKGVYERKDFLKGDPELGKAYGFAGDTTQVNIRIGRFVKAGDGSYVLPMGVYLVYEEPKMLARPGQMGSSFARINVMPENISVEIEDEEETTVVKHITVAPTFVKSSDRWFDMKGRSLGEKPTAKGTYYHNGQRVIIK